MGERPYFSLIVTTRNSRIDEFQRFIESIENQEFENFELIVVNQGDSLKVNEIVKAAQFNKKLVASDLVSLSKARNIGLEYASGEVIAFPDDDCWYPNDLLLNIADKMRILQSDCISCAVYDPVKKRYLSSSKHKDELINITELNVCKYIVSVGFFCKISSLRFDEELGVGAKWGAGEESDYIYRLLKQGYTMIYVGNLKVYHPYNVDESVYQIEKAYKYGVGYGALVKKTIARHQYLILIGFIFTLVRTLCGIIVYFCKGNKKSMYYLQRFKGMLYGIIHA